MSYQYIFLSEAQEEYEEALNWYMEQSRKVAEHFVIAVNNALVLICEHPQRWRNEYAGYYELSIKKYPFSIVYLIDTMEKIVLITSVYHHRKKPQRKYLK